jgi:hypothetical protein
MSTNLSLVTIHATSFITSQGTKNYVPTLWIPLPYPTISHVVVITADMSCYIVV